MIIIIIVLSPSPSSVFVKCTTFLTPLEGYVSGGINDFQLLIALFYCQARENSASHLLVKHQHTCYSTKPMISGIIHV